MAQQARTRPPRIEEIVELDPDGDPMPDSGWNLERHVRSRNALRKLFRRRGQTVFVGAGQFIYPVAGDPTVANAPDLYAAPGCDPEERTAFKCWEEPAPVVWAGEFLSVTLREKLESSRVRLQLEFYRVVLRTPEVFLYEPGGAGWGLGIRFRFLRLDPRTGRYNEVQPQAGWYRSAALDLDLRPCDGGLDFRDPHSGEEFLAESGEQGELRIERAQQAAEQAQQVAEQAQRETEQAQRETEQAQQVAEQAQRETKQARQEAEQARQEAEQARQAAEREAQARRELEERLRRLEGRD